MNFCTKCGNPLEADLKFCTRCGARVEAKPQPAAQDAGSQPAAPELTPQSPTVTAPEPPASTSWQTTPVVPQQQVAANSKSSCLPILLTVLGVLALVAVLVIGGLVYADYKLKQKATAILHETTTAERQASMSNQSEPGSPAGFPSNNPAGLLGNLTNMLGGGNDDGDLVQSFSDKDPVEPCPVAPFPPQTAARIPLQAGTVITTAWGIKYGDVETRIAIDSATATSVTQTNKSGAYKADDGHDAKPSSYTDAICNADFASASTYVTVTSEHMPHLIHGVTRLRLSDKSFNEVKATGKTYLTYLDVLGSGEDRKPTHDGGLFARAEPQDVPYPMIVNDQGVTLPAIHLAGITDSVGKDPRPKKYRPNHAAADVYVLDDPLDPLVLLWKEKDPVLHDVLQKCSRLFKGEPISRTHTQLLDTFHAPDSSRQLRTQQAGICSFIGQATNGGKSLVDGTRRESERFQIKAESQDHRAI